MEIANENFEFEGRVTLVSKEKVIIYEIILNDYKQFIPINEGVWKFVFQVPDNKLSGFTTYTKEKVDYNIVEKDITDTYKEYIMINEFENEYRKVKHYTNAYYSLLYLRNMSMLKLQFLFPENSGQVV
jgi:hypothetical protein